MSALNTAVVDLHVGFSSCTCGWTACKDNIAEAARAAEVHALSHHRNGGGAAALPIMPLTPRMGAWSLPAPRAGEDRPRTPIW
jgi:hypothetical protein